MTPSQLELFIRTITANPSLADLAYELVVDPEEPGAYIPFVRDALFKRLRHLKTLVCGFRPGMTWAYPPRYHVLVARFPITELAVHFRELRSSFRTVWFETFRLIWSLRHLARLHLDMQSDSAPGLTEVDMQRLRAIRRPWACASLTTLVLDVSSSTAYHVAHSLIVLVYASGLGLPRRLARGCLRDVRAAALSPGLRKRDFKSGERIECGS